MKRLSTGLVAVGMLLAVAVPAAASHLSFTRTDYDQNAPDPRSAAHADFDGDGDIDVATANTAHDDVSVFLNDGSGGFTVDGRYAVSGRLPWKIVAADVTGEGVPDLVTPNYFSEDVSVLKGQGDGTFAECGKFSVPERPRAVATGDFDRDGHTDLAVPIKSGLLREGSVRVLFGDGQCNFPDSARFTTGVWPVLGFHPSSIVAGDLNGDGRDDLAVANFRADDVSVLLNTDVGDTGVRAALFELAGRYAVGADPTGTESVPVAITTGDINDDGNPDLITANELSDDVSVLRGLGDGLFHPAAQYDASNDTDVEPSGVATADLNGDGIDDVAVSNFDGDTVGVLTADGDGGLDAVEEFTVNDGPADVIAASFDGGKPDLATANTWGDGISILLNTTP